MVEDQLKGNWDERRGKVRERWNKLTEEDLEQIKGRRDLLIVQLQKQYGIEREEAEAQVLEWEGGRF